MVNALKYNPTPPEYLSDLLEEMLEYYKKNTKYDILIKAALFHYQFESLHPFLGGNGRMGRLLIHEVIVGNRLMNYNVLPLSEYLVQNRVEYFDRLWSAQCSRNLDQWIEYFITGVLSSAALTIKRLNHYVDVRKKDMIAIENCRKYSADLMVICEYLEENILIDIKTAAAVLPVSFNTASKIINILTKIGVLKPLDDKKRYKIYIYSMVEEILN